MSLSITSLFCCRNDFARVFEDWEWPEADPHRPQPAARGKLTLSEVLFIMTLFHLSPFRDFKRFSIYAADSTKLAVCHNIRTAATASSRVRRGRTTTGWFYGFKLHLVIDHRGEIMAVKITPGNTDDRACPRPDDRWAAGPRAGRQGLLSPRSSSRRSGTAA